MDNANDLKVLLASRYPLILAETRDEQRFLALLRRGAATLKLPVWTWSSTKGLARDGNPPQYGTADPRRALAFVSDLSDPGVFVFVDAHPALEDPLVVRSIKEAAHAAEPGQALVLTGPTRKVPPELEGLAVPWSLRPPDREELERLVDRTIAALRRLRFPVAMEEPETAALVEALQGLSVADAERLIQRAVLRDGELGPDDVPFIRAAKAELLNVDGVFELVEAHVGTLDEVAGLNGLKEWLWVRGKALDSSQAKELGLDPPRGVLLTGIPGCGKSLIAKTLARTWDLPLVLLDPSRLYGPYVGESEQRLHRALQTVEAMAPVVLWIDEIEKGFAVGGAGDGGVSKRLLGSFLRWTQERPAGVFIVATANDVSSLPPEFLRKGRFDEIFFVDLPGPDARAHILRHHLTGRGRDPGDFDLPKLVETSDGFSGAELEAAVVGALYRAFGDGVELTTEELLAELEGTVPLSVSRAEEVAALRAWAAQRAVTA
ncbi:MAG: AAA family ATPase [Acidimicrobiia bacterium]